MNAQKVVGIAACALACVASVNLLAEEIDWFDGNVGNTTTSAISTPTAAAWNASLPDGVTPAEGSITLDNDQSTPLLLTPTANSEPPLSDGVVTISSTAILTPSDAADLSSMTINSAKAGFAAGIWDNNGVATTNFYGYTSDGWVKLAGADVPNGTATSFKIVLDYRTGKKTVKFFVGDTQLNYFGNANSNVWNIATSANALANVAAYGSGSLSALAATCEQAVAAVDGGIKYGSAAEAVIAAGANGTVLDIDPTTGAATSTKQTTNGLYAWQCDILGIDVDETIPLQPATKEVASDKIAVAVSGYTPVDGVSVKFQVKRGESLVSETKYDADAIGIPMKTGQYTVVPEIKATASN